MTLTSWIMQLRLLEESSTEFLMHYSHTEVVFQTPLEYNEHGYAFFPDKYYRLYCKINWTSGKPSILKFKDGEGRRKQLHLDALMIKAIQPDITYIGLLYNLVFRR